MRDRKIGEYGPIPPNLKEKYKNNFENILQGIINQSSKKKTELLEEEIVFKIKRKDNLFQISNDESQDYKNNNKTSEESSEDFADKSNQFMYMMNKDTSFLTRQPVLIKKNSILAFEDNSDLEELELNEEFENYDKQ